MLLAAASSPGFLLCYLGALRAGAVVVLANPGWLTGGGTQATSMADSGAAIAFADPGPAQRLAELPSPPLIAGPADLPQAAAADRGRAIAADRGRAIQARPQDTAVLAYTSGTTGRPKGVPLSHRQLVVSIRSAMAAWGWSADDVLVHALPLFHQHGLGGVHAALIAGSTAHLQSRFDAAALIETARATDATVLFGVPTIYRALLGAADHLRVTCLARC